MAKRRSDKGELTCRALRLLRPSTSLLCKLASVAVHAEELMSNDGHPLDLSALDSVMHDAEVREWVALMKKAGLAPVKRKEATRGKASK